jgi:uncharacterized repeat protein (TIGR03803 family)
MINSRQLRSFTQGLGLGAATGALALAIAFVLTVVATQAAQAQTYQVLYNFTGAQDGAFPEAGVTMDVGGNLYGTAFVGGYKGGNCSGTNGCGTVYKLTHKGSGWIFNLLYTFTGGSDGTIPGARVIFGPNGTLFSTTARGGSGVCSNHGCGTVFNLRPPATACKSALCPWSETVLYSFAGPPDGATPDGEVAFDQGGNMYGTSVNGGSSGDGTVWELTPSGSGWMESVLYSFSGNDGAHPFSELVFDSSGNLYGTTSAGGAYGYGVVFKLTSSGSGWTENVLYSFAGGSDGGTPYAGVTFDQAGNLYGATSDGGTGGGGTVFKLTPSGGGWTYSLLLSFTGATQCGPVASLTIGSGGLYGTTYCDGAYGFGSVFQLASSDGSGTYKDLYDFTGGLDGAGPISTVLIDKAGKLYGTAQYGGQYSDGVVWEITP